MSKQPHISLICSRLDLPGGIERTIINLANLLMEKGHTVTLLILDEAASCFYPVSPGINMVNRNMSFGIEEKGNTITRKIKLLKDIFGLKKILKKLQPDIIISTEYQFSIAAVLAGVHKHGKLISWEHHHFNWLKRNRFWESLYKRTYRKIRTVVCQNTDEVFFYTSMGCKAIAIPYHLHIEPAFRQDENNKEILSIGWLIPRKGTDLLMIAANDILQKYPDWTWRVIGEGEMKKELLDFITANKLEGRLLLDKPVSHDLDSYYKKASIFVMTSRMESFGMVLAEAMCYGVPCVAFDCETGPRHVIRHNKDGFLAEKENTANLATAISWLIEDTVLRKKMGEKAVQDMERFSPERIYSLWEQLFAEERRS